MVFHYCYWMIHLISIPLWGLINSHTSISRSISNFIFVEIPWITYDIKIKNFQISTIYFPIFKRIYLLNNNPTVVHDTTNSGIKCLERNQEHPLPNYQFLMNGVEQKIRKAKRLINLWPNHGAWLETNKLKQGSDLPFCPSMQKGKSRNRRTFPKIENLRFLQNYDEYNCIFGIKLKGLSLSFIWRVIQWN